MLKNAFICTNSILQRSRFLVSWKFFLFRNEDRQTLHFLQSAFLMMRLGSRMIYCSQLFSQHGAWEQHGIEFRPDKND